MSHSSSMIDKKMETSALPTVSALRSLINGGDKSQERWENLSFIGMGGFGHVYKAYDNYLQKEVAIKFGTTLAGEAILFKEFCFCRRANMAGLGDRIPMVHLVSSIENTSFMVMDFAGISLADFTYECGQLYRSNIIQVGIQLLDILQDLHSLGIVHCDLKPANIMTPIGNADFSRVKIIDFGMAKEFVDRNTGNLIQNRTGLAGGTLDYISRNIQNGKAPLPRDDAESLAYVLLELFTGYLPWATDNEEIEDKNLEYIVSSKRCELLKNLPARIVCMKEPALAPFLEHIHQLGELDFPNYEYLKEILRKIK
ncbi:unnamed protein product [Agarophyton chilense]